MYRRTQFHKLRVFVHGGDGLLMYRANKGVVAEIFEQNWDPLYKTPGKGENN